MAPQPAPAANAPASNPPAVNGQAADASAKAADAATRALIAAERAEIKVLTTPPIPSIPKAYQAEKSLWAKIWIGLGKLLTAPLTALALVITFVTKLCLTAFERVVDLIVDGPVWLVGKIFHLDTEKARELIAKVIAVPIHTVGGIVRGVMEVPGSLVGTALSFVRQLTSFEWVTSGQRALQLLFTPVTGSVMAAIWPLGRGGTALDDLLHPPRCLTDEERKVLLTAYPASALTNIRVHPETSWLSRVMSASAADFSLGTDVYLTETSRPALLLHELIHRMQSRDSAGGVPTFLTNYSANILSRLPFSSDPIAAYASEDDEAQAYRLSNGDIAAYTNGEALRGLEEQLDRLVESLDKVAS